MFKKLQYIPQFLISRDFRRDYMRRRILYPLLTFITKQFFPNIRYFTVCDEESQFTAPLYDRGTGWSLLIHGHLDKDHFDNSLKLSMRENLLKKNSHNLFIDVGANIGTHSMYALRSGFFSQVIAVEPHPDSFQLLIRNLRDNGLEDKCSLFHCALGEKQGTVQFEIDPDHSGDHRIKVDASNQNSLKGEADRETIAVPMQTLDDIFREVSPTDYDQIFVSIDVQGFEPYILSGAKSLINQGAIFCIEFWPYGLNHAGVREDLNKMVQDHFNHYFDVRDGDAAQAIPTQNIQVSYSRYHDLRFTDLLLVQNKKAA
jgi:FkbM family methyltransferase